MIELMQVKFPNTYTWVKILCFPACQSHEDISTLQWSPIRVLVPQITNNPTVCSTACSGYHEINIKSPSLWGESTGDKIGPVTRNAFLCDDRHDDTDWTYKLRCNRVHFRIMMTSSNGNIFRVTGPLCGEFTGPGEFPTQRPVTRSFDVLFDVRLNKRLSKQPWGWWFETPSWSLWRQCNDNSHKNHPTTATVYPKKYAHGFVVLCFVVVMQSFIINSHEVFIHIHQGCFAGTGAIVRLPQCQWSKPDGYGKISQCITTTKHSKAKTVCIFLGIYCTPKGSLCQNLWVLSLMCILHLSHNMKYCVILNSVKTGVNLHLLWYSRLWRE